MARYIPKSKVSILETTGNEFVIASTNQPYKGKYMELSNGTFFAGNNPQNPGEELLKRQELSVSFGVSKNNSVYRKLKRPVHDRLSKKSVIPVNKPQPTNKDYERGYFTRYFCRRINDQYNYFEIDKKTHTSLNSKTENYDYNLYIVGQIKWTLLETPIYDIKAKSINPVNKINKTSVELLLETYPFLDIFFNNLTEYEPLHTRNFTETLFIKKGVENVPYEGYFHQHPEKGFMEGPYHTPNKKHQKLFTDADLLKNERSLLPQNNAVLGTNRFGDEVSMVQGESSARNTTPSTSPPSAPPPSAPSYGGGMSSGGGGGGY